MAESRRSGAARQRADKGAAGARRSTSAKQATGGRTQAKRADDSSSRSARSSTSRDRSSSSRKTPDRQQLSAADAASCAREGLSELIGRPVEVVLGIDRDHGNWIATVQVVELARIPNTTDVLGEYETVIDGKGDILRYQRKRRYHRAQVDGGQQ